MLFYNSELMRDLKPVHIVYNFFGVEHLYNLYNTVKKALPMASIFLIST